MSDGSIFLRFDDVSVRFGETTALDHVSFEIAGGESRIVYGIAGSGKTTLLKAALGLVKVDSGRIYVFGQDVTDLEESAWFEIRARMGILFQEGGLFDSMTIAENVAYPLVNSVVYRSSGKRPDDHDVEAKVQETLRFVDLEQTLEKFPSELSGGMRRRVGIARAVVTEPPLVLYDSPTAGLDPITANTIVNLILKERDLRNAAAILVTHRFQDGHLMAKFRYNPSSGQIDAAPAKDTSVKTKFFVMNEGRLVFEGTLAELKLSQDPYVSKFAK